MAGLSLKSINKKYPNGYHAVKDVNLEIEDKEFIVLVGPSGCGKSTTLRMIAGLEDISSGELYIEDRQVNEVAPKDRDIAMVFQNYALYPHMTVYDNMAFGLKLRKVSKAEMDQKVKTAAQVLGIEDLLSRKPKELSGGQRQRVALGRAIVREPKVFLMDEPLSNLDAKLRVQMRAELIKLHNRLQTTFIYVTHDQTEAMTMGSRIVVMKDGIVQQVADPQTIYDKPANLFVASFIGSPQMNFIDSRIIDETGKLYIEFQGVRVEIPEEQARTIRGRGYEGKEVIFGIRPQHIYKHTCSDNQAQDPLSATIEVKELLGSEIYLYLIINGHNVTACMAPDTKAEIGQSIDIYFDMKNMHLFDKETQRTVL